MEELKINRTNRLFSPLGELKSFPIGGILGVSPVVLKIGVIKW